MDYSNFVRNFYRKATNELNNFHNYYGTFVNVNKKLDIPDEYLHNEEIKNLFMPSFVLNIDSPTKYFIEFMDYYVKLMPELGFVFADKDRINALYNNAVDMNFISDDEKTMDYIDFEVMVGVKALENQGILEK